jgi:hypothetical protein
MPINKRDTDAASVAESVLPEEELMDAILLLESAKTKLASPPPSNGSADGSGTLAATPEPPMELTAPDLSTPYDPKPPQHRHVAGMPFGSAARMAEDKTGLKRIFSNISEKLRPQKEGKGADPANWTSTKHDNLVLSAAFGDDDVDMLEEKMSRKRYMMFFPPLKDKARPIRSVGYFWSSIQMILIIGLEMGVMAQVYHVVKYYLPVLPENAPAHTNANSLLVYEGLYMLGLIFQWFLYIDAVG